MEFWSKGLGNRTVSLRLSAGEAVKSGDRLYVQGRTEEPVVWDYIMPLRGADFTEFFTLLRDPRVAKYLYQSPHRWRLYRTLLVGGTRFLWLLVCFLVVGRRRPVPEEPTIVVPPPSKRRSREGRSTADSLARLSARRTRREVTPVDAVDDLGEEGENGDDDEDGEDEGSPRSLEVAEG